MGVSGECFDVIIIGAGIMGSSTAYQTAERGLKTLVLEQFDFLHHRGSSHGETRSIRATYPQDYYYPMVMESYKLWRQAEAQIGYQVYYEAHHFDMGHVDDPDFKAVISNCRKYSVPHQILRREQVTQKFAGRFTIPDDWLGLAHALGGVIKPTKATAMYQALAHQKGAVLRDNMEVVDIKRDDRNGGVIIITARGEIFRGKKCVVTVGAWMRKLVKSVSGIELPIQPLETHVCYWRIKDGHEDKYVIGGDFPTFASYGETYIYGTPTLEYPGLIKVAVHGGNPCDPDNRPWGSGAKMDVLKKWLYRTFSGKIDTSDPVVKQACMYSMTPTEDFVIDFLGGRFGKDVVVGGGFSGHGFKMAPVIGRVLADLAAQGETKAVDMSPFRIGRFIQISRL